MEQEAARDLISILKCLCMIAHPKNGVPDAVTCQSLAHGCGLTILRLAKELGVEQEGVVHN